MPERYHSHALRPVRVISNDEIAAGTYLLSLDQNDPFLAGQTIRLALDGSIDPRIYSLCSAPGDPYYQILFDIKKGGVLTPSLAKVKSGDSVLSSSPYGSFTNAEGPACWIATGTGIAPFRSMLRARGAEAKTLLHGVRHADQFYFADEFAAALGKNYHRCCSRDTASGCFPGRVDGALQAIPELPLDVPYFLCGSAIMVVEVRDLLIARGVPFPQIVSEIYF